MLGHLDVTSQNNTIAADNQILRPSRHGSRGSSVLATPNKLWPLHCHRTRSHAETPRGAMAKPPAFEAAGSVVAADSTVLRRETVEAQPTEIHRKTAASSPLRTNTSLTLPAGLRLLPAVRVRPRPRWRLTGVRRPQHNPWSDDTRRARERRRRSSVHGNSRQKHVLEGEELGHHQTCLRVGYRDTNFGPCCAQTLAQQGSSTPKARGDQWPPGSR